MTTTKMTKSQATEWVYDQDEQGEIDRDELTAAYVALYGSQPDADDSVGTIWSHCCNATPNCGTRPLSTYSYFTDAVSGEIEAESLQVALDKIVEENDIDANAIADGAFAWVEDANGNKLSIAQENEF